MTFDTAMFIVCILVINAFIFAAMRSPRICAIIFGALLAVPPFLMGYVYDALSQYPKPYHITGYCNHKPSIMNNTDLCPSGLHHQSGFGVWEDMVLKIPATLTLSYYSAVVVASDCCNFILSPMVLTTQE
ncbi:MAG: hypothetical protein WBZ36_05675 [Candidatus Nitrosopolaris sp.]